MRGNPYPVTEIPFTEDETGKILEYNPDGFYGKGQGSEEFCAILGAAEHFEKKNVFSDHPLHF